MTSFLYYAATVIGVSPSRMKALFWAAEFFWGFFMTFNPKRLTLFRGTAIMEAKGNTDPFSKKENMEEVLL
jgi:hypothetical protein